MGEEAGKLSNHAVQQPQDGFEHDEVLQGGFNKTFKNKFILLLLGNKIKI